jgi:hypothetical protein
VYAIGLILGDDAVVDQVASAHAALWIATIAAHALSYGVFPRRADHAPEHYDGVSTPTSGPISRDQDSSPNYGLDSTDR